MFGTRIPGECDDRTGVAASDKKHWEMHTR